MSNQNHSIIEFFPASEQSKLKYTLLQNVRNYVEEHKFVTNWYAIEHNGWILPSTKDPHDWCGLWQTFGCLHSKEHEKLGKGNRVYVKQYQRSCYRALCIECYLKWIARQANVSTQRIEKYVEMTDRTSIHLVISVNPNQYYLSDKQLRQRLKQILEAISFTGGAIIFHPFKFSKTARRWYYAPHFHIVGFTWRSFLYRGYGKFGWFVKDLGIRISVFQTFCYLLSHCGIKKGSHTLTWIGRLSYSKLKVEKEPKITCCPVCGADFIHVYYNGVHPVAPPDRNFEGLVDDDGEWYPVQTMQYDVPRYDYAPTRELNDLLHDLAITSKSL